MWKAKIIEEIKTLDPNCEVLKIFDPESQIIKFANSIKEHQKQKWEDETYVRAYLVVKLIKELNYPCNAIELEKPYSIGHPSKKEARLDILVKKDNDPFMLIECKTPDKFEEEKDLAIKNQLYAIAKQEIKGDIKPKYLIYYTVKVEDGKLKDNAIIIDFEKYPTYEDWIDKGEPHFDEIPAEYGIAKKYIYANIDKEDPIRGLKPLRKDYTLADFERLRIDLHNKLWAGGEADYNDIFYHLIKIMLVKIYDELITPQGKEYQFQVFYKVSKDKDGKERLEEESPKELVERLEKLYKKALKDLLNYDDEKITAVPLIERDKFTEDKFAYAVKKLQEISLTENIHSKEEDILGLFFERILQNEFKQSKGQYFTHKNIVRFLIYALELDNLAIEKLNQTYPHFPYIIDPACGSGTFLIEAMKIITREVLKNKDKLKLTRALRDKIKDLEDPERKHRWAEDYIYGIEPNARLGLATKLNMILHGDGNMNIFIEDGLMPFNINGKPFYTRKWQGKDVGLLAESYECPVYPKPVNAQFDVVLSNPPFSLKIEAMRSYKYLKDTFVFHDKKNSENLFIERWYQLLKPKGRLGVVLPESVFDTKENLYIRMFLYKYFKIKAIISLPKEAFEPYTSTKVSLLIAEKKTDDEVKAWDEKWRLYAEEYNKLRKSKIIQFFIENDKLLNALRKFLDKIGLEYDYSKVFVEDLYKDVEKIIYSKLSSEKDRKSWNTLRKKIINFLKKYNISTLENSENKKTLERFLKDFYPKDKTFNSFKELLEYVYDDVLEVATLDYPEQLSDGIRCNCWWVFGEVAKHFNYPILYAHAENIGYKRRTNRTEIDKDIPIRDENGNIIAFKNDLFKIKAEKVKRQYWVKKGDKEVLEEREEIIKTDIIIDTENPETILDYIRKAKIWSDNPNFDFFRSERINGSDVFWIELKDITKDIYLRLDYHYWTWKKDNWSLLNTIKLRLLIRKLESGNAIKREDYAEYETDYIHIVPRNIQDGCFVEKDLIFLKYETGEKLYPYRVRDEDILLVISSNCGDCLYFNISEIPDHLREKQFTVSHYIVKIRPKDFINAKVLAYYLNYIKDYFRAVETGKTQKNLPLYYVFNIPISSALLNKQEVLLSNIAPIEQQIRALKSQIKTPKEIVDEVLSKEFGYDLNEFKEMSKRNVFFINLSDITRSYLLRNSTKFHHPKYDYILEILSKHKTVKLRKLLREPVRRGVQPKYSEEGEIMVIKTVNLRNGYIDLTEVQYVTEEFYRKNERKAGVKKGDVLMASTGTGSIGKVDYWDYDDLAIVDSHVSIIRVDETKINPRYLTFYLRSIFGQIQVEVNYSGMSNQIEIYPNQIENFEIICPPMEKQKVIVQKIEQKIYEQKRIEDKINELRKKINEIIERELLCHNISR